MKPIAVGDLVQVVKPAPCCGYDVAIGRVFVVKIIDMPITGRCENCGDKRPSAEIGTLQPNNMWIQVNRLKRIPPLSKLEGVKADEPIKEPA